MTLALTNGSWILLAVIFVVLAGIVFGHSKRRGNDISLHPYHDRGDDGELGLSAPHTDVGTWTHGTGGEHRHGPAAPPEKVRGWMDDPELAELLTDWREHPHRGDAALTEPFDASRDHHRGPEGAVELVVYSDLGCGPCRELYDALAQVREEVDVSETFRHFPLADRRHVAVGAALAVEFAAAHDRAWAMIDEVFARGAAPDAHELRRAAEAIGVDADALERATSERAGLDRVVDDVRSGIASGVNATPTVFVDGARHDGEMDAASLVAAIRAARASPLT